MAILLGIFIGFALCTLIEFFVLLYLIRCYKTGRLDFYIEQFWPYKVCDCGCNCGEEEEDDDYECDTEEELDIDPKCVDCVEKNCEECEEK